MIDRDSQLDKVLMGAPIGIAAAAVAYGGGHWVLVVMLGVVSLLITAAASVEVWRSGAIGYASLGLALMVLPVGFAGLLLAERQFAAPGSELKRDAGGSGLERTTGVARAGEHVQPPVSGKTTDLVTFSEVAQLLRTAKRATMSPTLGAELPADVRYAVDRVRAWETVGVRHVGAVDPATGQPLLPPVRIEALNRARRSFEDKIALEGRRAVLTVEEAAWAAHTLGDNP